MYSRAVHAVAREFGAVESSSLNQRGRLTLVVAFPRAKRMHLLGGFDRATNYQHTFEELGPVDDDAPPRLLRASPALLDQPLPGDQPDAQGIARRADAASARQLAAAAA